MKLSDLRKITVKKQIRIRFRLPNGMECILNEHGIAEIPALKAPPDFNLEKELSNVDQFTMEPVPAGPNQTSKEKPRNVNREQLAALIAGISGAGHGPDDHDE
jgi:hypothetical protein